MTNLAPTPNADLRELNLVVPQTLRECRFELNRRRRNRYKAMASRNQNNGGMDNGCHGGSHKQRVL